MTTRIMLGSALAAALLAAPAMAAAPAKAAPPDAHFMMEAAGGGMAEVQMGQLAASKASSADVKAFGQMMVDDHSKANEELKGLAGQKNVTLPANLPADAKAAMAHLEKLSGDAFDKAYMQHMVMDHKKDVAAFEHEAKMGKDADAKAWAAKTLPTLQKHLQRAEELAPKPAAAAHHASTKSGK